jgi:hypothetical protein
MASSLGSLPSDQLLSRLHSLIRRGNAVEAELLAHLGEVDARRLYLGEACSSMFAYCVRVLHFAEAVAYKRIAAARAARRHPEVLEAVRRGDLHVTGVSLLAPQLTSRNGAELIEATRHKTADEIRRLLADRQPKPDVPASVRRLPTPAAPRSPMAPGPVQAKAADGAPMRPVPDGEPEHAQRAGLAGPDPISPVPPADPMADRAYTQPLGGERYCVRFTADPELHQQLQELRALMRHQVPDGDIAKILARAVSVLLDQVRKRKFGESSAPRPVGPSKKNGARHVPASIRRIVVKRDGGRCSYVSPGGRRCGALEFLEFHHREPWARTPAHAVEGIALHCRAHNQHQACRDFGQRHMGRFRKTKNGPNAPSREGPVSRPAPECQLDLDPVGLKKPGGWLSGNVCSSAQGSGQLCDGEAESASQISNQLLNSTRSA